MEKGQKFVQLTVDAGIEVAKYPADRVDDDSVTWRVVFRGCNRIHQLDVVKLSNSNAGNEVMEKLKAKFHERINSPLRYTASRLLLCQRVVVHVVDIVTVCLSSFLHLSDGPTAGVNDAVC